MASAQATTQNGHVTSDGNGPELSAAQKLMQRHDEAHKASIEDVVDEDDLPHGEHPASASVLEDVNQAGNAPGWAAPMSAKAAGKQKADEGKKGVVLDTQSHELFPELGGAPKPKQTTNVAPIWTSKKPGANSNSPNGASTPNSGTATPTSGPQTMSMPGRQSERIQMFPNQMLPRAQMKKPLPDILKDINKRSKATVTTSTGPQGVIIFTAVGPQDACRQALKDVIGQVGSKQVVKVPIPRSTRAHIIGKGGATIKALQEKTGARIQMPRDESPAPADDDDDDAVVDVLIEGNAHAAEMARQEVLKIAGERTATMTTKLRDIPAEFYPFIAGPHNARANALEEAKGVQIRVPQHNTFAAPQAPSGGQRPTFAPAMGDHHITLAGDRAAVQAARAEIERQVDELRQQLILEQLAINKGRHQFIVGERGIPVNDFFADTGCAIILPTDEDDDMITVVGPADKVQAAAEKAMDLAMGMQSSSIDVARLLRNTRCDTSAHARNLARYLRERKEIERLERQHQAHIVTPIGREGPVAPWELYSRDGKNAIRAQSEITSIFNGLPPSRMSNIPVDPFFHQHLRNDITPRVRKDYGVHVILPDPAEGDAPVLLVFEGPEGLEPEYKVPRGQPTADQVRAFKKGLEDAEKHILEIINAQAEIVSKQIDVPQIFHEKLRKFIKKEQQERAADQIPVRVSSAGTVVTLRGPAPAVEALAEKVEAFVVQAIEDEKERGFTMSFDFPQAHANKLIGKGGSNISELREKFDVEIQVDNGKVELKGPKAKAEAAKAHITSLGKQWADEATYTLLIEPKYHRELIGAGGSQINRLQTRYKVQIHFPRSAKPAADDQSNADAASESGKKRREQAPNEVIVKGPKKGADEARDEILSLLQYLKDNSYTDSVTVQQSQIPSLIGQRGSGMDELRQLTGAKIDVPNARDVKDPSGMVEIQLKGTKSQVAQAKKMLEEKKNVFDQIVTKTLEVDKKHHRALIGSGGANLRDIILKAGGSDDRRELARTVQFPKADSDGNTIKIEGNRDVVDKIIAQMQDIIAERESQVTETIDVPTDKHRNLIGRGGDTKRNLESQFKVSIDIPKQGSGQTNIKITGRPENVEKAQAHILEVTKEAAGETVQVPRSVHHIVADNGQFFRKLRNNHQVTVDHAGHKVPPKPAAPSTRANGGSLPLITDDADKTADAFSWNVVSNSGSELDGEIPWVLRGPEENVPKAKAALQAAIEQALKNNTTGYLVLPDPRTYRYVIGQGGSKVNSIREATGCKITVPRDQARDEAIEISGSADGVEKAKELILKAVKEGGANENRG
ncbi:putative RNA binding effector protein Scp160 [Xylogone sp. PMI_703]|nr:putative RNA binding effector protein Scp160 [Xylogone sp. PMI_703]